MALKESMEVSDTVDDKPVDKATYWLSVLKEWKHSGLKQQVFCEKRAISYTQFGYWRARLNRTKKSSKATLIPVQFSEESKLSRGNLEVRLSKGVTLSIPGHYPEATLNYVLRLLEGKPC